MPTLMFMLETETKCGRSPNGTVRITRVSSGQSNHSPGSAASYQTRLIFAFVSPGHEFGDEQGRDAGHKAMGKFPDSVNFCITPRNSTAEVQSHSFASLIC